MSPFHVSRLCMRTIPHHARSLAIISRSCSSKSLEESIVDPKAVQVTTVSSNVNHIQVDRTNGSHVSSSSCSQGNSPDLDHDENEEDEKVDMFAAPHKCLGHDKIEWNGPTRGGKYAEPTRFGDWERKGRCSDF